MLRVKSMYEPIELITFNVFDYGNSSEWKAVKAAFYSDNEDIKAGTRELIDTSFRKLRSAEGACELLQNFKRIKSKGEAEFDQLNIGCQAVAAIAAAQTCRLASTVLSCRAVQMNQAGMMKSNSAHPGLHHAMCSIP